MLNGHQELLLAGVVVLLANSAGNVGVLACPVGSGTAQYCKCIDDDNISNSGAGLAAAITKFRSKPSPALVHQPPIAIVTGRRIKEEQLQQQHMPDTPLPDEVMVLGSFSIRCERAPSMEAIRRELLMQTERQSFNSLAVPSINISYVLRELFITKSRLGQLDSSSFRFSGTTHPPNDGHAIPMTVTIDAVHHLYLFDNDLQLVSDGALRPLAATLRSVDFVEPHLRAIHDGALFGLARLETLNIVGTKLRRLPKLALLPSLKSINVVNSRLQSVKTETFAHLPALETINLTHNQLTTLFARAFSHLRSLIRLILRDNQIITISPNAIEHLPQLQVLNLENNRLTSLVVQPQQATDEGFVVNSTFLPTLAATTILDAVATSLIRLDLSGNQIWQLPGALFNFMPRLVHLDLSNNTITAIAPGALHNLPSLRVLDLSHNRLISSKALSICNAPALQELDLGDNSLGPTLPDSLFCSLSAVQEEQPNRAASGTGSVELQLNHNTNTNIVRLNRLSLANNRLRSLPSVAILRSIPNLQLLDLSNNLLMENATITNFNDNFLWHLPTLRTLNLAYNKISGRLPPFAFANHTHLHVLTLRSNQIDSLASEALQNLPSLALLDLGHNNIMDMGDNALHNIQHLRHLLLPHNQLIQISAGMLYGLHALQTIDFSFNHIAQIRQVAFKHLNALELLDLSHNHIKQLNNVFRGARTLQVLDLSHNLLNSIINDFSELPALRQLSLAHNALGFLGATTNFVNVPQLHELDLNYNVITASGLQLNVSSLQVLKLSHNKLDQLSGDMFMWTSSLRDLNVSNNQIKTISAGAIFSRLADLASLDLSSNIIEKFDSTTKSEPAAADEPSNIELLFLQNNRLPSMSARALQNLPLLRYVDLSSNHIKSVDFDASGTKNGPPKGIKLQNLTVIKLADNRLTELTELSFVGLPALRRLVLNNNSIEKISPNAFVNLPSLMEVNLNANRLTEKRWSPLQAFGANSASNILFLHLASNQHSHIPAQQTSFPWPQHFPQLLFIDFSNNNLDGTLDLSALVYDLNQTPTANSNKIPALDTLNFAGNHIDRILLTAADKQQHDNKGNDEAADHFSVDQTASPPYYFSQLSWLDVSNNKLAQLPLSGLLRVFPSLEYLNLSQNRLKTLRPSDLATHFKGAYAYPPANVRIKMAANPWHCTCTKGLAWLQRWLRAQHVVDAVYFDENFTNGRKDGGGLVSARSGGRESEANNNNALHTNEIGHVNKPNVDYGTTDGDEAPVIRCETPRRLRGTQLVFAQLIADPNDAVDLSSSSATQCIKIPGSSLTSSSTALMNDEASNIAVAVQANGSGKLLKQSAKKLRVLGIVMLAATVDKFSQKLVMLSSLSWMIAKFACLAARHYGLIVCK